MSTLPTAAGVKGRALLWTLPVLLAVAILAALLYKVWPLLYPTPVARAPLEPACDLRAGPCTAALPGGGGVRLAVEPREIPVMRPLRLDVAVADLDVRTVDVDFSGVDMNMGYNRVRLAQAEPGRFVGQATLPVCVRSRMTWEALVLLETPRGLLAAPFRFETRSP